jgi:hypothetical protein
MFTLILGTDISDTADTADTRLGLTSLSILSLMEVTSRRLVPPPLTALRCLSYVSKCQWPFSSHPIPSHPTLTTPNSNDFQYMSMSTDYIT